LINGSALTLLFLEGSRTRHLVGWSQDKVSGEEQFHSLMAPQNALDLRVFGGGTSSAIGTNPGIRPVTSSFWKWGQWSCVGLLINPDLDGEIWAVLIHYP
jgi:hypothetical protein